MYTTCSFCRAATSFPEVGALSALPWCVLSMLCNTTHVKTTFGEVLNKVDNTNEAHCIKQVQKRGIIKDTAKKQRNYICQTVQVGNNGKSCHDSVNECQNKNVVAKNTEKVDDKQGLQDVPQYRTSNLTYVGIKNRENTKTTEENLSTHTVNSWDIPCRGS